MKIDKELHTRADLDELVNELVALRGDLPGSGDLNVITEIGRLAERLMVGPPSMGSGPGGGSAAEFERERSWYMGRAVEWHLLSMLTETPAQSRLLAAIDAEWRLSSRIQSRQPVRTTYASVSALTGALMPGEALPGDGGPLGRLL